MGDRKKRTYEKIRENMSVCKKKLELKNFTKSNFNSKKESLKQYGGKV